MIFVDFHPPARMIGTGRPGSSEIFTVGTVGGTEHCLLRLPSEKTNAPNARKTPVNLAYETDKVSLISIR
jgi:hypothetical protein